MGLQGNSFKTSGEEKMKNCEKIIENHKVKKSLCFWFMYGANKALEFFV